VRALKLQVLPTRCVCVFHTVFKTNNMDDCVFVAERKRVFFGAESAFFFMKFILQLKLMLRRKLNKYFAPLKRFLNSSFVPEHGIQIPINSHLSVCDHATIHQCSCVFTLNWKQPSQILKIHFLC